MSAAQRTDPYSAGYPQKSLSALVTEVARRTPAATALISGGEALTYVDLESRATALAHRLVASGVRPGQVVGVGVPRGSSFVVGLLAVLKAGAAYLPLDPEHPARRWELVLGQAGCTLAVTTAALAARLPADCRCVDVDAPASPAESTGPLPESGPDQLACVLFTSGSTGAPKGVAAPHRSVVRMFFGQDFGDFGPDECVLQCAPVSWDGMALELWSALLHGGTCVLAPGQSPDPQSILELAKNHDISTLFLPTSLFNVVVDAYPEVFSAVRQVFTGGEAVSTERVLAVRRAHPGLRLVHCYGPVESMVFATCHGVDGREDPAAPIPIGVPISHTRVTVTDPHGDPAGPDGVGELRAGGDGLAWGYLGQPGLTAERFTPDPAGPPGSRTYRTGDLVRVRQDGELEFHGRFDDLVKVRGFRIECGEVEAELLRRPGVRSAAVVVREDEPGDKRLVGYLITAPGTDLTALRADLDASLPAHLIPTALVPLDRFPLRDNGKLDRDALPAPVFAASAGPAPVTAAEQTLAEIWAAVLRVPAVGADDDFFRLGGDSILIMQVVARARKQGLRLKPAQVFRHRTLAELASVAEPLTEKTDPPPPEPVDVPLTPVQRWFFATERAHPDHFNQSVTIPLPGPVDADALRTVLAALPDRHDALRLRFTGGRQHLVPAEPVPLDVVDLTGADEAASTAVRRARGGQANGALDLERGPLCRAVLFDRGPDGAELLLVAHHLVVDAVSWRLLADDLLDALRGARPTAGGSFAHWATALAGYDATAELPYWRGVSGTEALPADHPGGDDSVGAQRTRTFTLDAAHTAVLLRHPDGSGLELLLAALTEALASLGGSKPRLVDLEAHGREDLFPDIDPSRTVGWFTTIHPFALPAAATATDALGPVRDALAAVPRHGVGHGLLVAAGADGLPGPAGMSVNYLGRLHTGDGPAWRLRSDTGPALHPDDPRPHPVAVVGAVLGDELTVYVDHAGRHRPDTIDALAGRLERALLDLLRPAALPVTPAQAGMVFHSSHQPGSGVYLEQRVWTVSGDPAPLVAAWQALVERHDALRAGFRFADGDLRQFLAPSAPLPVRTVDTTDLDAFLAEDRRAGFDLSAPPLARLAVVRTATGTLLVLTHHHAVLDGWSYGLLLAERDAVLADRALPPAPSFRDFLCWQQAQPDGTAFWREHLAGARPTLLAGTADPAEGHREVSLALGPDATRDLDEWARDAGLTLGSVLHGCWALVLAAWTGELDVLFGTTFAVRPGELDEVERLVGLLNATVPLRVRITPRTPVLDWLRDIQDALFELREQPPETLADIAAQARPPVRSSLFDTLVAFENYPVGAGADLGADTVIPRPRPARSQNNFPLTLIVKPGPDLVLKFVYAAGIGDDTAGAVGRAAVALLRALPESAGGALGAWCPGGAPVRRGPAVERPDETVVDLIVRQARQTPDAPAIRAACGDVSYRELLDRASRLAHTLHRQGVGVDVVAGVCLPRGVERTVAVLGVMLAGGAYLPMDPDLPDARLDTLVRESGAHVVVTGSRSRLPGVGTVPVPGRDGEPAAPPRPRPGPDDLAYVISTSGSTGTPKAVGVGHRALYNRLAWMTGECGLRPDDVVLQKTAFSFDVAVWECLWPLTGGAAQAVAAPGAERDPAALSAAIDDFGVTVAHFVPSALDAWLGSGDRRHPGLRLLVCSGETLAAGPAGAARTVFPRAAVHNLYGPTEAAIDVTARPVPAGAADPVPIGTPISNAHVVLLDRLGRPAPEGAPGELCVGGVPPARGYLGRPGLTAERFVPDPSTPGARLYRTGDLARWTAGGELLYLGRTDHQVKIRGVRVEADEVAVALRALPGVAEAAVVPAGTGGDTHLVGYVVPADLNPAALRAALAERLPEHLVPAVLVPLASLPLTASGKLDRAALPDPGYRPRTPWAAPRTATEEALAGIWARVLNRPGLGVDDDFFELGGHSLTAMRLAGAIGRALGRDVGVGEVFAARTVAALAARLDTAGGTATGREPALRRHPEDEPAPLSFAQEALWLLDRLSPGDPFYTVPTALRLEGDLDMGALGRALAGLMAAHPALRTRFAEEDGLPRQEFLPAEEVPLPVDDVTEEGWSAVAATEFRTPFDLSAGPLLRARLLRISARHHVLLLTTHHIVSDADSRGLLLRDLAERYAGGAPVEPAVGIGDAARWERDRLTPAVLARHREFWLAELDGAPEALVLPAARPRPAEPDHGGAAVTVAIPGGTAAALHDLARAHGATAFMVLLAAASALLTGWAEVPEVVVATPVSQRTRPELADVVGLLVNTVPLRVRCEPGEPFAALLERARDGVLRAVTHSELQFSKVVEALAPPRVLGRNPIAQVLVQWLPAVPDIPQPPGLGITVVPPEITTTRFDLSLTVRETGDGLRCTLTHATALLDRAAVTAFGEALVSLLTAATADPAAPLAALRADPLRTLPSAASAAAEDAPAPNGHGDERRLAGLWAQVLGLPAEEIPSDGHFFRLGGHSLLASQLCARIHAEFGRDVDMATVFRYPRLAELAAAIAAAGAGPAPIRPRRRPGAPDTNGPAGPAGTDD